MSETKRYEYILKIINLNGDPFMITYGHYENWKVAHIYTVFDDDVIDGIINYILFRRELTDSD